MLPNLADTCHLAALFYPCVFVTMQTGQGRHVQHTPLYNYRCGLKSARSAVLLAIVVTSLSGGGFHRSI